MSVVSAPAEACSTRKPAESQNPVFARSATTTGTPGHGSFDDQVTDSFSNDGPPLQAFTRHADHAAMEANSAASRQDQLTRRLAAIRARLGDLQERDARPGDEFANQQVAAARHQVAISVTAAEQAVAACVIALRRAADAHYRTADLHDEAAARGSGDENERRRHAEYHRAAATADRQRADEIESMIPGQSRNSG